MGKLKFNTNPGNLLRPCFKILFLKHFKNFLFFETESYYVAQTGLKLMGNLSEPPLGWKSGHLPYTN